jgi:hypothetical protein
MLVTTHDVNLFVAQDNDDGDPGRVESQFYRHGCESLIRPQVKNRLHYGGGGVIVCVLATYSQPSYAFQESSPSHGYNHNAQFQF